MSLYINVNKYNNIYYDDNIYYYDDIYHNNIYNISSYENNYIVIVNYKHFTNYDMICKYKDLLLEFNIIKNKVYHHKCYLKKVHNSHIGFYHDGIAFYKEIILNKNDYSNPYVNGCKNMYLYYSNIDKCKYMYLYYSKIDTSYFNIYSLFKYLLSLCFYCKNYDNNNYVKIKKFNCMRYHKNIIYIITSTASTIIY